MPSGASSFVIFQRTYLSTRIEKGSIDSRMLPHVGGMLFMTMRNRLKEVLGDVGSKKLVTVVAEDVVGPDAVTKAEANKPTGKPVALQLLQQMTVGRHLEESLQQESTQKHPWWDRRATNRRVQLAKRDFYLGKGSISCVSDIAKERGFGVCTCRTADVEGEIVAVLQRPLQLQQ